MKSILFILAVVLGTAGFQQIVAKDSTSKIEKPCKKCKKTKCECKPPKPKPPKPKPKVEIKKIEAEAVTPHQAIETSKLEDVATVAQDTVPNADDSGEFSGQSSFNNMSNRRSIGIQDAFKFGLLDISFYISAPLGQENIGDTTVFFFSNVSQATGGLGGLNIGKSYNNKNKLFSINWSIGAKGVQVPVPDMTNIKNAISPCLQVMTGLKLRLPLRSADNRKAILTLTSNVTGNYAYLNPELRLLMPKDLNRSHQLFISYNFDVSIKVKSVIVRLGVIGSNREMHGFLLPYIGLVR